MRIRKMVRALLCILTALCLCSGMSCAAARAENTLTGEELMRKMRIGWNLGNTFDAPGNETAWGNPKTTQEMLETVKALGFDTLRMPISWSTHVGPAPEYRINERWMERVDTVVNQALDAGLYVIINSHHDNEIYMPTPENRERGTTYLSAIWSQIAEHFRDAPYELIFQTMNEPRVVGASYEWTINMQLPECVEAVRVVNDLNQAALDAIRATGGNNADRFVVISPYAGSPAGAFTEEYHLPADSVPGRLIQSIHSYSPYNLCLNRQAPDRLFNNVHMVEHNVFIDRLSKAFNEKGVPVLIDEMGCLDKDNPEQRYKWAKHYVSTAAKAGIPCIWWDNGAIQGNGELFGLLNRRSLQVYAQSQRVYEGLMEGLDGWDNE